MAYGSLNGLKIYMRDYDDLIANTVIDATTVTAARTASDNWIDTNIARVIPAASLPLSSSAPVNDISDMLTACKLYTGVYIEKDPNESAWISRLCERAQGMLDDLVENPDLIESQNSIAQATANSNTKDIDRAFTRTLESNGTQVGDAGTMEDW